MIVVILVAASIGVVFSSSNIRDANPHQHQLQPYPQHPFEIHEDRPIWRESGAIPLYAQSSFYYADYKSAPSPKKFLPPPPNCPNTGRTVCEDIDQYPSDRVFEIVKSAKARKFNFSSIFADERDNDAEPSFEPPKQTYPQVQGKGYVVYQTALPVLPIRYLSQQNRKRQPTHQIVFPHQNMGSYEQQIQRPQQSPPPSPAQQPQLYPNPPMAPPSVPQERYPQQQPLPSPPTSNYQDNSYQQVEPLPQPQPLTSSQSNYGESRYMLPPTSHSNGGSSYNAFPRSNDHLNPPLTYHSYRPSVDPYNLPPPPPSVSPTPWKPVYPDSGMSGLRQEKMNIRRYKRQSEDDNDVEPICRTTKQFISPKVALNDKSEWKYIVNLGDRDPRLRQIIKVDVCSNANEPCSNQISLPFGFTSRCKQKYIKKKLLSLDPDGQGTSAENFFVPSCCVCEIVRTNDTSRRRK